MTSYGKKFLSAFVEVTGEKEPVPEMKRESQTSIPAEKSSLSEIANTKFIQYFDKLFSEANIPGPDYYEFSKMIEAMNAITDEKARFCAAFAGLGVQGLNKLKLLSTAADYLKLLDEDAANFHATIDSALQIKVLSKQNEMQEKNCRIQELSAEITDLQNKISFLKAEIKENEKKIQANTGGYHREGQNMKNRILLHVEKIKEYIH